jgi:hypothetical protein
MSRQSKGSKQLKVYNLSSLDGVRDVAVGHKARAERHSRNDSKSQHEARHDVTPSFDDVVARNARWGV